VAPGEAAQAEEQAVPMELDAYPELSEPQRKFFEYAGPLFSVVISPTSSVVGVGGSRALRAVARDRARRLVEQDLMHVWRILEGEGTLEPIDREIATFRAANEPGLARVEVAVTQGEVVCRAEAQITVTASLVKAGSGDSTYQGLPGYTYHKAAGSCGVRASMPSAILWSSTTATAISSMPRALGMLKLRYICRLFAKELVLKNFVGIPQDQLLERLLELTLYTEENLR
jgi:hypothetical protein